jgi:hypothetical protein
MAIPIFFILLYICLRANFSVKNCFKQTNQINDALYEETNFDSHFIFTPGIFRE